MKTIQSPNRMQKICMDLTKKGKTIGFVPTMGYLHEGHLSLIRVAKKKSDVLVVSIFVNPTQFGPQEDLKKYPRNLRRDKRLLKELRCDYLFYPQIRDMYTEGYETYIEVGKSTKDLEGACRPGHFQGVTTIVAKLFSIIMPNVAVFGQKDFQQVHVLKRMVKDLNFPVKILVAPTIREKSGLALSSRNSYLSIEERKQALSLYKSLNLARKLIKSGERDSKKIKDKMRKLIQKGPKARIDYIAINDSETLEPLKKIRGNIVIPLAVKIGNTRLIDNIILKV
ncbi:MAG: pantoate--beta-alanine ligase [Candidatus Zixiibacteriota bacterium]